MSTTDLVAAFERIASEGATEPRTVESLLSDLAEATADAVEAVETLQAEATDRVAKLDALWDDVDGDSVADLDDDEAERVAAYMDEHDLADAESFFEEVTYLLKRVREQSDLVQSLTEDYAAGTDGVTVAERVVAFARESDGPDDELPGDLAIRYRDAVLNEE